MVFCSSSIIAPPNKKTPQDESPVARLGNNWVQRMAQAAPDLAKRKATGRSAPVAVVTVGMVTITGSACQEARSSYNFGISRFVLTSNQRLLSGWDFGSAPDG
jgi:hypothetical protein